MPLVYSWVNNVEKEIADLRQSLWESFTALDLLKQNYDAVHRVQVDTSAVVEALHAGTGGAGGMGVPDLWTKLEVLEKAHGALDREMAALRDTTAAAAKPQDAIGAAVEELHGMLADIQRRTQQEVARLTAEVGELQRTGKATAATVAATEEELEKATAVFRRGLEAPWVQAELARFHERQLADWLVKQLEPKLAAVERSGKARVEAAAEAVRRGERAMHDIAEKVESGKIGQDLVIRNLEREVAKLRQDFALDAAVADLRKEISESVADSSKVLEEANENAIIFRYWKSTSSLGGAGGAPLPWKTSRRVAMTFGDIPRGPPRSTIALSGSR